MLDRAVKKSGRIQLGIARLGAGSCRRETPEEPVKSLVVLFEQQRLKPSELMGREEPRLGIRSSEVSEGAKRRRPSNTPPFPRVKSRSQ